MPIAPLKPGQPSRSISISPLHNPFADHISVRRALVKRMELLFWHRLVELRSNEIDKNRRPTCQSFFGCWAFPSS
jgi:hypothetical protein